MRSGLVSPGKVEYWTLSHEIDERGCEGQWQPLPMLVLVLVLVRLRLRLRMACQAEASFWFCSSAMAVMKSYNLTSCTGCELQ